MWEYIPIFQSKQKRNIVMMKKTVVAMAALSISLVSGNVFADTHPLMGLDKDQDGFVSLEEAQEMPEVVEAFDVLDVNKDGKLDVKELFALK
jgi:hypothetical protein